MIQKRPKTRSSTPCDKESEYGPVGMPQNQIWYAGVPYMAIHTLVGGRWNPSDEAKSISFSPTDGPNPRNNQTDEMPSSLCVNAREFDF
jgi:hypothetical protein